jgi:hypothetical protein
MENSCDQDNFVVAIVDNAAVDDERANAVAELRPIATHSRLIGQEIESIEDRVNTPIGGRGLESSAT